MKCNRATKNLIPKGSKFKIKNNKHKEIKKYEILRIDEIT